MGFFENSVINQHNDVFLDRVDITDTLEDFVIKYKEEIIQYKVISYYGMGGIGKSRLIKRIYESYNGTDLSVFHYPLEILSQETLPSILFHIRKNFTYTPHFDYALLRYWEFVSYPINQDELFSFYKKLLVHITAKIDAVHFEGISNISDVIRQLIYLYDEREISAEERVMVRCLLTDKANNLYNYLVESLSKDIQKEMQKNQAKFLFLFDAYDKNKGNNKLNDWLKIFINSFETGLFIVSSREKLDWFKNKKVKKNLIYECSLECIPKEEVRIYLREENYNDEQIEWIISKTECIPLYLDLAINNYDICSSEQFVGFEDKDELVRRVLDHLSAEEQQLVEYFSVVKLFNQTVFDYAVIFNQLSPQKYVFSTFNECAIIRYTEEYRGLYKIHSVLAKNIAHFIDKHIKERIILDYLNVVAKRIIYDYDIYNECKYNLVINIYTLIEEEQINLSENMKELLLDMFFYLNSNSFGKDFSIFIDMLSATQCGHLKYIYEYIIGKNKRATNITEGLKILQSIPVDKCSFGKHKKSLQCDINYLLSISGQYDLAEKLMLDFVSQLSDEECTERYYYKGKQYYYDMLMLRGKFVTAIENFTLLENSSNGQILYYETQKAIGHCYRFNFMFEEAMTYYSTCDNSKNSEAYYLTVYCESLCYFQPEKVIEKYNEALKKNEDLNNYNNLGKIHYSVAIAYLSKRNYKKVKAHLKESSKYFTKTKYHAGLMFKCLAEIYYNYSKERKITKSKIEKIVELQKKLNNVYEYLLLPVYVQQNKDELIEEYRKKFEWINFDKTIQYIKAFWGKL